MLHSAAMLFRLCSMLGSEKETLVAGSFGSFANVLLLFGVTVAPKQEGCALAAGTAFPFDFVLCQLGCLTHTQQNSSTLTGSPLSNQKRWYGGASQTILRSRWPPSFFFVQTKSLAASDLLQGQHRIVPTQKGTCTILHI